MHISEQLEAVALAIAALTEHLERMDERLSALEARMPALSALAAAVERGALNERHAPAG